jgi:hypothetical protein
MTSQSFRSTPSTSLTDKAMTAEQFTQVIDAILSGKYSWACLLILRFAGYNPLHYIPYRTYNRLIKENALGRKGENSNAEPSHQSYLTRQQQAEASAKRALDQIPDLAYLDSLEEEAVGVKGGDRWAFWCGRLSDRSSKSEPRKCHFGTFK